MIEPGDANSRATPLGLLTLVLFGCPVRTAEEYGTLLEAAGFAEIAIYPTDSPDSVVEAVRPKRPVANRWNTRPSFTGGLRIRLGTDQATSGSHGGARGGTDGNDGIRGSDRGEVLRRVVRVVRPAARAAATGPYGGLAARRVVR